MLIFRAIQLCDVDPGFLEHLEILSLSELPAGLPPNYLSGLHLTATNTTQVDITAGSCRSDDDTGDIVFAAGVAAVLATSLDIGAEAANTWYYIWAFADSTGVNTPTIKFSVSVSAPTVPTGYDLKRRIGSCRNNAASHIIWFVSQGNNSRTYQYITEQEPDRKALAAWAPNGVAALDLSAWIPERCGIVNLVARESGGTTAWLKGGVAATRVVEVPSTARQQYAHMFPVLDPGRIMTTDHGVGFGGSLDIWVEGYTEEV